MASLKVGRLFFACEEEDTLGFFIFLLQKRRAGVGSLRVGGRFASSPHTLNKKIIKKIIYKKQKAAARRL